MRSPYRSFFRNVIFNHTIVRFTLLMCVAPLTIAQSKIAATPATDRIHQHAQQNTNHVEEIAVIQKLITSMRSGNMDYSLLSENFANEIKSNITYKDQQKKYFQRVINIESVEFLRSQKNVQLTENVYRVWFKNGRMIIGLVRDKNGKIQTFRLHINERN